MQSENNPNLPENLADAIADGVVALDKAKKLHLNSRKTKQGPYNFSREFKEIDNLDYEGLQAKWCELYNCNKAPAFSKTVLVYKLKYRLQELMYGGLSEEDMQLIKDAINEHILHKTRKPKYYELYPEGTIITKEYKDNKYSITILKNGYLYQGRIYKEISAIVRKITGTNHWSAARFFGLEK